MTTPSNLYLAPNADFNLGSNTNVMVFGSTTGDSEVDLPSIPTNAGIVVNANTDHIGFGSPLSSYAFQAVGNTVNVYQASTSNLLATIDVDTASTGTLLSFGGAYGSSGFGTAASPLALKINPVGNSFNITLNGVVLSTATNGAVVTLPTAPSLSINSSINTTQAAAGVNAIANENSGGIGDTVVLTVTDSAGHQVTESSTMASSGSGGSDHSFTLSPAQIATLSNGTLEVGVSVTDSNGHISQTSSQAVTLAVTPAAPVFTGATVNASTLVMSYTDLNPLSAQSPAASAFTVVDGSTADAVSIVAVNASAKTVTLTLATPVANGDAVTVAYVPPSSAAIQDGLYGVQAASLPTTRVTNTTPTPPPVFAGATVNGSTLTMTYTDSDSSLSTQLPASSAFTVKDGTATDAVTAVQATGPDTFTLTLTTPVVHGDAVTVAYAVPGSNPIHDGNAVSAASLPTTSVTNTTPTPPPQLASATVNGNQLVLNYTDVNPLNTGTPALSAFAVEDSPQNHGSSADAVTNVVVNANTNTVTLTLASAVGGGDTVTFGYTAGIGSGTSIQDSVNGLMATSIHYPTSVTNLTPTPPVLNAESVNGNTLTLSYTDANNLGSEKPANGSYTVMDGSTADAVTNVTVNQAAKTVTLTLTSAVANGDAVTVAYTAPGSNPIQDGTNGGVAANISASTSVANATPLPAPTAVTLLASGPTGDNVVANTYNNTNTELTISATIAAAKAGETADFYVGGVQIGSPISITTGATTVSDTVDVEMIIGGSEYTALAAGGAVTVKVIDASGNVSAASTAATLSNVSANPPATPTATAVADGNGGYIVSGSAPTGDTVTLKFSDSASGSATATSAAASGGAYSIDVTAADLSNLSSLQNGAWHVSAVATATNGNISAAQAQPAIIIEPGSASSDSYSATGNSNASATLTSYDNLASGFVLNLTESDYGSNGGTHLGNIDANLAASGGNLTLGIDPNSTGYLVYVDNLTVSNVATLTFDLIGTASQIGTLTGTMSKLVETGSVTAAMQIDAISDSALTTIDASAAGNVHVVLGDVTPLPQNNLSVTIGSASQPQQDFNTVDTSGNDSVIVINDRYGANQVTTSGSASNITIVDASASGGTYNTIIATGTNAVITAGNSTHGVGADTITASGSGAQVTFLGTQYGNATAAVGSKASVTFGSTSASATQTVIVTGDLAGVGITGTASSGNYAFTTLNNVITGVGDLVTFADSTNEVLGTSSSNGTLAATIAGLNPTTALATALNDAVAAAASDLAPHSGNTVNGVLEWFRYDGNTYVVEANYTSNQATGSSAAHSALSAADAVVEFSGSFDLSNATLSNGTLSGFSAYISIDETANVSGIDTYSAAGSASNSTSQAIYNNLASTFELDVTNTSSTNAHLGSITANSAASGGSLGVFLDPTNGGNAIVIDSLHVSNVTTLTINNPGSGGASITSLISTDNALTSLVLTNANAAAHPSAGSGSAIEIGGIAGASSALGHPFFTIDATATTSTVTLFDAAPITQNSVEIYGGTAQTIIGNWSNTNSPTDGLQGGGGLVYLGSATVGDNNANNYVYSTGNNFIGIDGDGANTVTAGPGAAVFIGLSQNTSTQDASGDIGANVITEAGNGAYIELSGIQNGNSTITVGQNANVYLGTTSASATETVVVTGDVAYDATTNYNHVGNSSDYASTTLNNVVTGTGDQVSFNNSANEILDTANNTALATTVSGKSLANALDAAVAQAQSALTTASSTTTTGVIEWFVNGGNTYIVEANYTQAEATTPANAHVALSATDAVVELVGVTSISPVLSGHTVTL